MKPDSFINSLMSTSKIQDAFRIPHPLPEYTRPMTPAGKKLD
jgi:hypothetical protein